MPGQSGNPKGRPRGIARQARDLIDDDPGRLLAVFLEIAQDDEAKPADRVAAADRYLDRAYGKAPAYAPVEGADPLDRTSVDHQIVGLVDELAARREAPATGETPPREVAAGGTPGAEAATG